MPGCVTAFDKPVALPLANEFLRWQVGIYLKATEVVGKNIQDASRFEMIGCGTSKPIAIDMAMKTAMKRFDVNTAELERL